jgi:hypothetical protein
MVDVSKLVTVDRRIIWLIYTWRHDTENYIINNNNHVHIITPIFVIENLLMPVKGLKNTGKKTNKYRWKYKCILFHVLYTNGLDQSGSG